LCRSIDATHGGGEISVGLFVAENKIFDPDQGVRASLHTANSIANPFSRVPQVVSDTGSCLLVFSIANQPERVKGVIFF
jgi:hypothetical protein